MDEDQYACGEYGSFTRGLDRHQQIPMQDCLLPVDETRRRTQGRPPTTKNEQRKPGNWLTNECYGVPGRVFLEPTLTNTVGKSVRQRENAGINRAMMSGGQPCYPRSQNASQMAYSSTPSRSMVRKSNLRTTGAESKNNSVCLTRSPFNARLPTPNQNAPSRGHPTRDTPIRAAQAQTKSHTFGKECLDEYGGAESCVLDPFKGQVNSGMLEWLLNKFWARQQRDEGTCPLIEPRTHTKINRKNAGSPEGRGVSRFESKTAHGTLQDIDDLWNPEKFIRWKYVEKWDQYKESTWKQLIYSKLDCPQSYLRDHKKMMEDAFNAFDSSGGECVAFRMIYGILKRNEDMYLNEYLDNFADEQFIQLIVAMNRFFHQDKDKRKDFLGNPPPTSIESIMMKETLNIIDPGAPFSDIARRFWELLLDWYTAKVTQQRKKHNHTGRIAGQSPSSAPSSTKTSSRTTVSISDSSIVLGAHGIGPGSYR